MKLKHAAVVCMFTFIFIQTNGQWHSTQGIDGMPMSLLYVDDTVFTGTYSGFYTLPVNDTNWSLRNSELQFDLLAMDSNKIISATDKGLYISEDKGYTWQFLDDHWTTADYRQIISMVLSNDTIWIATWDSVCMSADMGKNWDIIKKDDNLYFITKNSNYIYLSAMSGIISFRYSP